ncbi:hypothetical protein KS4_23860 [Poriferisphaera corsica]|uniref:Uncharacterized protein n=1 Tax=Poriferisphaera corsica TaxID=2528020 RepID=A0A517YVQ6_9BACT|nr:hypothetical protein [Poriferisphaera corsica]QDU34318.1 hypothetical protein KS4_23860 [Poriferisphaera corsica]
MERIAEATCEIVENDFGIKNPVIKKNIVYVDVTQIMGLSSQGIWAIEDFGGGYVKLGGMVFPLHLIPVNFYSKHNGLLSKDDNRVLISFIVQVLEGACNES